MNPMRSRKRVFYADRKIVNTKPKKCVSCKKEIGVPDLYGDDLPDSMCFGCPPMKDEPWGPTHSTPKEGE